MTTQTTNNSAKVSTIAAADWTEIAAILSTEFAKVAAKHDEHDAFVTSNFARMKADQLFSAAVPTEFGGGGATYAEVCDFIRILAQGCGSTALAYSMHSHLLAATIWRLGQGHPVQPLLERIVNEQLVLISTGASDWLESSGTARQVDGGYQVNGRKVFASGCEEGGVLVTSACFDDPNEGPTVLHFPVPFNADGIRVEENWKTMSMRATGSHQVLLEDVFVPESAIALRRAQGIWHPFFNVVVAVAMPIVMSAYVGVAEAAAALTRETVASRKSDPHLPYLLGEMENSLVTAQMALREMIAINDNLQFAPTVENASAILVRKTIVANAVLTTGEKAFEAVGGKAVFRDLGLERLLRDVHAAQFHPLPEKRQHHFTGRVALGLDPIA